MRDCHETLVRREEKHEQAGRHEKHEQARTGKNREVSGNVSLYFGGREIELENSETRGVRARCEAEGRCAWDPTPPSIAQTPASGRAGAVAQEVKVCEAMYDFWEKSRAALRRCQRRQPTAMTTVPLFSGGRRRPRVRPLWWRTFARAPLWRRGGRVPMRVCHGTLGGGRMPRGRSRWRRRPR